MTTLTQSPPTSLWDRLLEAGILDQEEVRELASKAEFEWAPLGQVLVREGFLTVRRVMELLEKQADDPDKRLGALAVESGYCSPADIDRALSIQKAIRRHPIEVLLEEHADLGTELFEVIGSYLLESGASRGL
jgi:hypothetical protein